MEKIPFSVAMCVYGGDKAEWFDTAIESIINQTLPPDEIVIVVDGPVPEGIEQILTKHESDNKFKIVRLKECQGHGNARRESLRNCSNEIVALMDADDISLANRFEQQIAYFEEDEDLSIVGGDITEFCGEPKNIVGKRGVPQSDSEIKDYLKYRCPMNQMTVMLKKSYVENAGGYIDWYCDEDYYLWIRMALKNMEFANTGTVLVNARVGKEMYNRRGGIRYFKSEAKLQKYMLDNKLIGQRTYISNVCKRLIVQVLLPNRLRGWVFKKFARE